MASEREEDLLAELKWLRHNQASLDARLQRVEDSLIFRFLRGAGTYFQSTFRSEGSGSAAAYQAWTARHLLTGPAPDPTWDFEPLMGIHYEGDAPESLRRQTYPHWSSDTSEADYSAELPAGIVLEPDVLARAVAALQQTRPAVIYFDHQIVDESGDPVRPIFKPDWSPTLVESCDYTGPFVLKSRTGGEGVLHIAEIGYSTRQALRFLEPRRTVQNHPLVSILICTRNADLLERCLTSLRANTAYAPIEIVIIHHTGGGDDSRIVEAAREAGALRVPFTGAFNFSTMNNLGAHAAKGEILLFLNDDVTPLDSLWLDRMAARLEQTETGAVGARLLYPNGTIQHAGLATWEMGGAGHPGRFLTNSSYWPWLNVAREVTAVTGACLAIRRASFDAVGGFDPAFPVNFNDVDLCLRLQENGFRVIYEAGAVLQHDESQTRAAGVHFEERRKFFLRWHRRLERTDPYYSPHLSQNDESLSLRD